MIWHNIYSTLLRLFRRKTDEDLYKAFHDTDSISFQAAIAAMQAELSNPSNVFMACEDKKAIIVRRSVRYADALVAELKKGGEDGRD